MRGGDGGKKEGREGEQGERQESGGESWREEGSI